MNATVTSSDFIVATAKIKQYREVMKNKVLEYKEKKEDTRSFKDLKNLVMQ